MATASPAITAANIDPAILEAARTARAPRIMAIDVLDRYEVGEDEVVIVGEGTCPWCGQTPVGATAGLLGYCPRCAGPALAITAPSVAIVEPESAAA
jgi:ribosomal protein S27AE